MTCKDCDDKSSCEECDMFHQKLLSAGEIGAIAGTRLRELLMQDKLCDRIPDTWTAEEIQQTKDKAEWIGDVIDAHSTPKEAQCPTTSSEDSDHHTQNKKSF